MSAEPPRYAEQPADWTAAGAHLVVPGVYRIPLPLPVPELHAVNVYAISDPAGLVLIDAGWAGEISREALRSGLGTLGYGLDDVAQLIITHAHWDHYTQAIALRAAFGCRVRLGRGEAPSITDFDRGLPVFPRQIELLRRCGAPGLAAQIGQITPQLHESSVSIEPPDCWLDDDEKVELGERTLTVTATPGHTRGHIVLSDRAAGVLFAGDHVLPHITPSLGLERAPAAAPLRDYLASLRLMGDQPDLLLLPAHGAVGPSVHTRVDELIRHHEVRLAAVLGQAAAGPGDAAAIASALRWTRRERRLDELAVMHQMMAVLEVEAHLQVLTDLRQLIPRDDADGVRRYAPA